MSNEDSLFQRCRRRLRDATTEDRVLVGFSGGLDSSVLVDLLDRLQPRAGPRVELVHVDHRMRPDSGGDATFCAEQARRRGLDLAVRRLDPDAASSQQTARRARLAAVAELALARGIRDVVFAHHADDRIESFLFHLRRGTGLDGLAPMRPVDSFPLPGVELRVIRPLLGATRDELEAYAEHRGLDHVTDPTNATDDYARNRIRHHLVPQLAPKPGQRRRILQAIENLDTERTAADRWADRLEDDASLATAGLRARAFRRSVLAEAPEATVARVFRRLQPSLDAASLDRIVDAIAHAADPAKPHRLTLSGCVVTVVRDRVVYEPSEQRGGRDVIERTARPVHIEPFSGGKAPFFGSWLHWGFQTTPPGGWDESSSRWTATFDPDRLDRPLYVSGFVPGAKLQRRRGDGSLYHQKLTKLFSAHRVDAHCRWRWPCLFDANDRLVWAAGLPRGSRASPRPSSRQRWQFRIEPSAELVEILQ